MTTESTAGPALGPRLCPSCGFAVSEGVPHDGYSVHPGPCLEDYLRNGPKWTPQRLRDRAIVIAFSLEES